MVTRRLGPAARKKIERAVDDLFTRLKARALGPQWVDKRIAVSFNRHLSLPGVFEAAASEEGIPPNTKTLDSILSVAEKYIDGSREKAKARTVAAVDAWLQDAEHQGVKTDLKTVLGGQLADVWKTLTTDVHAIIDSEAQNAKNMSLLDGIVKVNAVDGIKDPVVFWVVTRDEHLCPECKRLHLMEDGKTPRLWRLSEVGHGYHRKGQDNAKIGGLHPHCRCSLVTLTLGYGFNEAGFVEFKKLGYDEYARQQLQE